MKLIKKVEYHGGQPFETSPFIVFGKYFKTSCTITSLPDGSVHWIAAPQLPIGWYLLFNLPFSRIKTYVSTTTFENVTGLCRPRLIIKARRIGENKKYSVFRLFAWVPVKEEIEVRFDDAYLTAIKISTIIKEK